MVLLDIYNKVDESLDTINYNEIWPGFSKRDFALYTDEMVVISGQVLQKTDEFYANTSIWYEGRYVAIWKVDWLEVLELDNIDVIKDGDYLLRMDNGWITELYKI